MENIKYTIKTDIQEEQELISMNVLSEAFKYYMIIIKMLSFSKECCSQMNL